MHIGLLSDGTHTLETVMGVKEENDHTVLDVTQPSSEVPAEIRSVPDLDMKLFLATRQSANEFEYEYECVTSCLKRLTHTNCKAKVEFCCKDIIPPLKEAGCCNTYTQGSDQLTISSKAKGENCNNTSRPILQSEEVQHLRAVSVVLHESACHRVVIQSLCLHIAVGLFDVSIQHTLKGKLANRGHEITITAFADLSTLYYLAIKLASNDPTQAQQHNVCGRLQQAGPAPQSNQKLGHRDLMLSTCSSSNRSARNCSGRNRNGRKAGQQKSNRRSSLQRTPRSKSRQLDRRHLSSNSNGGDGGGDDEKEWRNKNTEPRSALPWKKRNRQYKRQVLRDRKKAQQSGHGHDAGTAGTTAPKRSDSDSKHSVLIARSPTIESERMQPSPQPVSEKFPEPLPSTSEQTKQGGVRLARLASPRHLSTETRLKLRTKSTPVSASMSYASVVQQKRSFDHNYENGAQFNKSVSIRFKDRDFQAFNVLVEPPIHSFAQPRDDPSNHSALYSSPITCTEILPIKQRSFACYLEAVVFRMACQSQKRIIAWRKPELEFRNYNAPIKKPYVYNTVVISFGADDYLYSNSLTEPELWKVPSLPEPEMSNTFLVEYNDTTLLHGLIPNIPTP